MTRPHDIPTPSRLVLSWNAATTATVAIARLTITVLFAAGIAAHAVVFLALPLGILFDVRRTVSKAMDVARTTVAHNRATARATGCHPPLPPFDNAAAASAYVATVAANAATSESVVNRTAAGLAGLFGDGFTAAAAALTPTHWGMCLEAAIGMADSERVVWLPLGGEMVATAIGRTLAAGVAALGPVTTMAASMAASFWIFPSLSASALMLSGVAVAWRLSKSVDRWWTRGTADKGAGAGVGGRGECGLVHECHARRRGPVEWEDARFANTWTRRRGRGRRAVRRPADEDTSSAGVEEDIAPDRDGREAAASPAASPMAVETEADVSPRTSSGAQSSRPTAVAAAVPAAPTVGWVWKLMAVAAGKGWQCRDSDNKRGVRSSVGGANTAAGGHGRAQGAAVTIGRGSADGGGSGRQRDAVLASDGEELRPAADERWGVAGDGADGDSYDDEWDGYEDGDAVAGDTDYPTDDDDDVVDDNDYATDEDDYPADGDDWDERGEWEARHPADQVAADRRRGPAGSLDRRRCDDDDAGAIPSDGEAVGEDARHRHRPRRASLPPLREPTPPPLPPPPPSQLPTVPRAAVAPRRTPRLRTAARR